MTPKEKLQAFAPKMVNLSTGGKATTDYMKGLRNERQALVNEAADAHMTIAEIADALRVPEGVVVMILTRRN